jgi:polar amino acid transport system substrate-binding protein
MAGTTSPRQDPLAQFARDPLSGPAGLDADRGDPAKETVMLQRWIAVVLPLIGLSSSWAAEPADPSRVTVLVEDANPPWSRADGSGYANEVVVAAYKQIGVAAKVAVVPYARCKKAVIEGTGVACVTMTWLPEFEGLVRFASEPLTRVSSDVFENVGKPLPRPWPGACKLPPGLVVGVVHGYEYPPETMALAPGSAFAMADSDLINLNKLSRGRLDAAVIITNDLQPRHVKAIESNTQPKVRFAFNCGIETGFIGFSVKHPQGAWALGAYESGYQQIKHNGVLEKIDERWGRKH